jgi:hypothetical protein
VPIQDRDIGSFRGKKRVPIHDKGTGTVGGFHTGNSF